ncbi:MAG: hypothetical protein KatS3mg077_0490 [Candidatus Binatia bacterium]|nr:MAG: hypothetical protein KatS3mg077_0490 [Candidatus Binatia bacterium]
MSWQVCFSTPIEAEAHVVRGFLESQGIPCVLTNRRFALQPLTFCALGEVEILVPEGWLPTARAMIRRRYRSRFERRIEPRD